MTSTEIRQSFLDFFQHKEHRIVESSPVVPLDDPTLLFTNAGMNQFKDVFLGSGKREYVRVADTQKCIRVSGKHNDLEEVGRDTYHHTFFEMLGNWSFGDYYKREAISWAWELLTGVWKLPKDRLHATVFEDDHEAFDLWKAVTDIDQTHIHRFGAKDNFWEMGETGPCGPCSEIHIDLTKDGNGASLVNAGSPFVMEIWNLVFIQYNRDSKGVLTDLPAKHVDTGMGFERICAVMQGKNSNYDTDVFTPIIKRIEEVTGQAYHSESKQIAMRVIADHIRMLTFAIADGAIPGNEGRGYVLRRILRRALRFGRNLAMREPFLWRVVETLTKTMGDIFPEIVAHRDIIEKVIRAEEESFNATLDRGLEIFEDIISKMKHSGAMVMSGDDAFKLYDTFGFPIDLTNLLMQERGYSIDTGRFEDLLREQRERSRAVTKRKIVFPMGNESGEIELDIHPQATAKFQFVGYDRVEVDTEIIGIRKEDGRAYVVLEQTPFYVESGGQISDTGTIVRDNATASVVALLKNDLNIIHVLETEEALDLTLTARVRAMVDASRRRAIMRNHTATHLLHAALRTVLGTHVQQAGSLVDDHHLRFDFSHYAKVDEEALRDIETLANEKILDAIQVQHHRDIPFDEAKKMGALMFFGDKYGDRVNVVQVGDYSMEFCGGTHVKNTSEIGLLKIRSESSIASGTRRIEAITGHGIETYIATLNASLVAKDVHADALHEKIKQLEKELARFSLQKASSTIDEIVARAIDWNDTKLAVARIQTDDADQLKVLGDVLREKLHSGVGVLAAEIEGRISLVCVVTDDLIKSRQLEAGAMVSALAKQLGGGGGGKPHLATAGGKDLAKLDIVLKQAGEILSSVLSS